MRRKFMRRTGQVSTTGHRATVGAAPRAGASDGLSPGAMANCPRLDGRRAAPCWRVFGTSLFFYLLLFIRTSLGGFEETNRGRFSLDLALKAPLGRNKVVRLGLLD